ncbi:Uncharacterized protein BM_BM17704 [Brugia malayi]|uniref:Uncharacterized protein n=1 Tax=Brugia malayi TaxID=6279 RepID=A0A4E9FMI0_BRUMA|nr:Uncharacterized protein BM_BM17704 [Brugia malayi]VIO97549.1 Uncharacterized protein BM_BM17704 [Brugia malayi]
MLNVDEDDGNDDCGDSDSGDSDDDDDMNREQPAVPSCLNIFHSTSEDRKRGLIMCTDLTTDNVSLTSLRKQFMEQMYITPRTGPSKLSQSGDLKK